jgi:hypothetical protein
MKKVPHRQPIGPMPQESPTLEEQRLENLSRHRGRLDAMPTEEANLGSHSAQPKGLEYFAVLFDLGVVMSGYADAVDFVSEFMQPLGEE